MASVQNALTFSQGPGIIPPGLTHPQLQEIYQVSFATLNLSHVHTRHNMTRPQQWQQPSLTSYRNLSR